MRVLLISTYDLGRQPFGLASPAAWLREAGASVVCADLSRERLKEDEVRSADLIAFFLPMHTATRLAIPAIDRVRAVNPGARLCAYGLYAPLNAPLLREHGVTEILAGEFEEALRDLAMGGGQSGSGTRQESLGERRELPRLAFRTPDRSGLPPLARYATLQVGGQQRTVAYTEASRGCKHLCRHCPIVPVYNGRFRVVPVAVVMADIRGQVASGARHVTFGDPDFFNGIAHAADVVRTFAREFPGVSYDVTVKIEHLLKHRDSLPLLKETGCAFVTSAVEAVDDRVLGRLEKGHTRADFEQVVRLCAEAALTLSPTFVAFTPWTTPEAYCDLLHTIVRLDLIDHVAPIQLGIRLLVTEGSRLLDLDEVRRLIGPFDARSLTYPWQHPDSRVDDLQRRLSAFVGVQQSAPRREIFTYAWRAAHEAAALTPLDLPVARQRTEVPYLNEPWYC